MEGPSSSRVAPSRAARLAQYAQRRRNSTLSDRNKKDSPARSLQRPAIRSSSHFSRFQRSGHSSSASSSETPQWFARWFRRSSPSPSPPSPLAPTSASSPLRMAQSTTAPSLSLPSPLPSSSSSSSSLSIHATRTSLPSSSFATFSLRSLLRRFFLNRYQRATTNKRLLLLLVLCSGGGVLFLLSCYFLHSYCHRRRRNQTKRLLQQKEREEEREESEEAEELYDVCIVGGGPAGSTCAYYAAKAGKRVLLLERKRYPHDKVCGDVITPMAQAILEDMAVLPLLIAEKECRWGSSGGFVSPGGKSFIGKLTTGERLLSVQRIILDERLAFAAEGAGATLLDGVEVSGVAYDTKHKRWRINVANQEQDDQYHHFHARTLVAADGADSLIARSLGVVTSPPDTYCCRSFAKAGTHSFPADADHVVFYNRSLLPGFFVVFHELEDFLNLCCYFIPCDGAWQNPKPSKLQAIYQRFLESDPHIAKALGPNVVITPCKFASMRVGGIPKSYDEAFLVIGDAAGQVDPLTGGGVHFGMRAAKIAAETLVLALNENNTSERRMKMYHTRWTREFGWEFTLAYIILALLRRFPVLLDAGAEVIKWQGDSFVGAWATAMMGGRSKVWFFYPRCALPIIWTALVRLWRRGLKRSSSSTK
ncbi:monooxygenase [Balamuthia mandrillaris]